MKLAVTGPLPIPSTAFVHAVAPATAGVAPAIASPAPQAPQATQRSPRLNETVRGGLTWAAISNLIGGVLPGRF